MPADPAAPVRSLVEVRTDKVILQQWDISCAAAAISTLLTFQHGDPTEEREAALNMMSRAEYIADPQLVRRREGFSLLDMKRFVERRGYAGIGYGNLVFDELLELAPVIVAVNRKGYQHFVIFRGLMGDRVLIADPAFGTLAMRASAFERIWIELPDLGRIGFVVMRRDGIEPPNRLRPEPSDFASFI